MSVLFTGKGRENTAEVIRLGIRTAAEKGIHYLVVPTTYGESAKALMQEELPEGLQAVVVTTVYGAEEPNVNRFPQELRTECEQRGIRVCTAGHALSGAERGLSSVFKGVYPVEVIANTLRMFGQGTKVAVEISTMAADAGLIPAGEPVIAMGGTGIGLDTAVILKAAYSAKILETRIVDYICKIEL